MAGMALCVLGSGSGGNCSVLIHTPDRLHSPKRRVILIDAGLSLRQTKLRLEAVGVSIHEVSEILITHFDRDHFNPSWMSQRVPIRPLLRFGEPHQPWARRSGAAGGVFGSETFTGPFTAAGGALEVKPIALPHDSKGTFGYRIDGPSASLGFATDLGRPVRELPEAFAGVRVLALESNYCPKLELNSDRPEFLKQRVMGGYGHLSNEQSLETVQEVARRSPNLCNVVALHLSRQCNEPRIVNRLYEQRAPHLLPRLIVTDQYEPTPWIPVSEDLDALDLPTPQRQEPLFAETVQQPVSGRARL